MDSTTLLAAGACAVLAALVYLMWREATKEEWQDLSKGEKTKWRAEEEERKEASGAKGKGASSMGSEGTAG